ncbi:anti-sigma factor RsiW [Methylopila capsulata]|uniref:Anti-sigma factor RsiW n=1 Tax=Methylopila capsulata TaxID=61654 RepID=A0A9W6MQR9_9HYPH|nr:anti-sigma factor [Methylopila capsulata]MBM7851905.1 anti-sigma factor RsiW [Methylopila capsulata]GLK54970.1 transcriptional regulator, anti-sigma factor [Methylopila capsulata]
MTSADDDQMSEIDLDAYVDDQLPAGRRVEVEGHLARHPALASRVMADLRARDELRLAFANVPTPTAGSLAGARRLQRAAWLDTRFSGFRRAAAVLLLIGAGWVANEQLDNLLVSKVSASTQPPTFVSEAVMAHRTALLRGEMRSQIEAPDYDPDEVRSATAIMMPRLPSGWKALDVQVFPSTYGPSVQMTLATEPFGVLSLYASRPGDRRTEPAAIAQTDGATAAFWRKGEVGYVLVANPGVDAGGLVEVAGDLARRRK